MKLSRRELLAGAAAGAVGAAGIYELVDRLVGSSPERAAGAAPFPEQHLLEGVRTVHDDGIEVLVPPLHHAVLTATVAVDRRDLPAAQAELERILAHLDDEHPPSPAGLGVTVAWGLPSFSRFVPDAWARHAPHDRRAAKPALLDTRRFPSDPPELRLESNDVAFLLRSDSRANVDAAIGLIRATGTLRLTSIRRGFA